MVVHFGRKRVAQFGCKEMVQFCRKRMVHYRVQIDNMDHTAQCILSTPTRLGKTS